MGLAARSDRPHETLPFLRRTQDPKDSKESKEENPQ